MTQRDSTWIYYINLKMEKLFSVILQFLSIKHRVEFIHQPQLYYFTSILEIYLMKFDTTSLHLTMNSVTEKFV